ncbi:hypothetical protein LEP1GSC065_4095 [Leptospira kirschneri serovar Sokoine str. RM1]|nr:hypothetical protein LEP1GSC065_4095 [Leptospira kirschneri serovar Sokoine str. RM1]
MTLFFLSNTFTIFSNFFPPIRQSLFLNNHSDELILKSLPMSLLLRFS